MVDVCSTQGRQTYFGTTLGGVLTVETRLSFSCGQIFVGRISTVTSGTGSLKRCLVTRGSWVVAVKLSKSFDDVERHSQTGSGSSMQWSLLLSPQAFDTKNRQSCKMRTVPPLLNYNPR